MSLQGREVPVLDRVREHRGLVTQVIDASLIETEAWDRPDRAYRTGGNRAMLKLVTWQGLIKHVCWVELGNVEVGHWVERHLGLSLPEVVVLELRLRWWPVNWGTFLGTGPEGLDRMGHCQCRVKGVCACVGDGGDGGQEAE